ncbi:MAG: DUF1365 domain-containing protein [Rhodospirillaceae bacterium]
MSRDSGRGADDTGRTAGADIYVGEVMHRRSRPKPYEFRYRVFSLLLDIDRIDRTAAACRWFSHNRFNLFSVRDRDHGPRDGSPLRPWIEAHLARAGLADAAATVRLLCMPRVLGYGFDPLSIWFCHDASGALRAVLYEVKNTFGDQHGYLMPVAPGADAPADHAFDKRLHVSPLIGMSARYRIRVAAPGDRLGVLIRESDDDGEFLVATLTGDRRPMTDATLLRLFAGMPLMTFKVVAAIHWQAVRSLARGVKFHRRPAPPAEEVTLPAHRKGSA